ncbi:hypothetical protein Salat_1904500 [Sesamum alatum]|uniref:Uncharacterized protein n=1 Tax=Sesamum alatum TaxID=300844 RepID=A0AAE1Y498_9LAMI|nr:hypothetical protein Salat_1904500 [Sesamum alatum]
MCFEEEFSSFDHPPASDAHVSAAPAGDLPSGSSERQVSTAVEVASGYTNVVANPTDDAPLESDPAVETFPSGSKDMGGEVAVTVAKPSKSKKRKQKHKHHSKRSSKLNKQSSKYSECRAVKEATKEEDNTKHLKELVVWWKRAREDLKTPSSKVAEMEGEKLNRDWAISAQGSVLRTHVGQDSFKLFKTCCLDRDQVLLVQTTHTQVEEHLTHVLMQCSMFHHDKLLSRKSTFSNRMLALDAKVALDAKLAATVEENKQAVANALEHGRAADFSTGRLAGKTEGLNEGRDHTFSQTSIRRLSPIIIFKGLDISSRLLPSRWLSIFNHLVSSTKSRLEPSLDATLQRYPEENVLKVAEHDEFEALVAEVGNLP